MPVSVQRLHLAPLATRKMKTPMMTLQPVSLAATANALLLPPGSCFSVLTLASCYDGPPSMEPMFRLRTNHFPLVQVEIPVKSDCFWDVATQRWWDPRRTSVGTAAGSVPAQESPGQISSSAMCCRRLGRHFPYAVVEHRRESLDVVGVAVVAPLAFENREQAGVDAGPHLTFYVPWDHRSETSRSATLPVTRSRSEEDLASRSCSATIYRVFSNAVE